MNVKNWSFFSSNISSKEGKRKVKEHILDTISLWGAIGLLWYSFASMLEEHFPEFLPVNGWVTMLFLFVLWLGYEWPKQYLKKLVVPCRLAGIAIPVAYVVVHFQKIVDGFLQIAAIYLPFVNSYYKTSFYLERSGEKEHTVVAFTAICMLLWWMVWLFAYAWKKRILLALFPLMALVLELMVGLSPHGKGLLFMLFGAMILATSGGTSVVKKAVVLACIGLSVFLSGLWFEEDIQSLATKETKQEVLDWQTNLSLENMNLETLLRLDLHFNWEKLNNNSPQYTGKTVLEIEADGMPRDALYLKGFHATTYDNGNWEYDDSYFKKACREAGMSEAEVSKYIFNRPYTLLRESANLITYKIKNVGTTGNVAYAPYYSNYESFDEEYTLMGDYLLKKSLLDDEIVVTAIKDKVDMWKATVTVPSYAQDEFRLLSEAYLEVPDDLQAIKDASKAALENMQNSETILFSYYDESGKYVGNFSRINEFKVNRIIQYVKFFMSYSLVLDELPVGADPIEYALTQSHEGYCMHFASAATLMLREAGIPARYVSGYVINPSEFEYVDGVFRAEVTDYDAHAWVEIYVENFGWIPIEATPGYESDEVQRPTEKDPQELEDISEDRREDFEQQESEAVGEDTETEESEAVSEEQQDTEESPQNTEDSTDDGSGTGKGTDIVLPLLKYCAMLLVFIGIAAILILGGKQWKQRYDAVLKKEMQKNFTKKAVKRMNRRIYRILRIKNPSFWFAGAMTDAAYERALKEYFAELLPEEWGRYMEIVKKNHYSHETISTEEMQYCYECYKKVNLFNKSLTLPWQNK